MNSRESHRKTLIERVKEVTVCDPAAFAKLQVSELDKLALKNNNKKKFNHEQISLLTKELDKVNHTIRQMNLRFEPLCKYIDEMKLRRSKLLSLINYCESDEKKLKKDVKDLTIEKQYQDSKLSKNVASMELLLSRGFDSGLSSTFHQSIGNFSRY